MQSKWILLAMIYHPFLTTLKLTYSLILKQQLKYSGGTPYTVKYVLMEWGNLRKKIDNIKGIRELFETTDLIILSTSWTKMAFNQKRSQKQVDTQKWIKLTKGPNLSMLKNKNQQLLFNINKFGLFLSLIKFCTPHRIEYTKMDVQILSKNANFTW